MAIWVLIVGVVLLAAGLLLYFFTNIQALISVIIGVLGTIIIIVGVILLANSGKKQKELTIEQQAAYNVRDKIDKLVPAVGKIATDFTIGSSRLVTKTGLKSSTLLMSGINKVARTAINAEFKIIKLIIWALFGLLLSEAGIGELIWAGEIGSLLSSMGFSGGSGLASIVGSAGGNVFGSVASGAGSLLGTAGSALGSSAISGLGTTVGSVGSTALGNVGVNLGLQVGEGVSRELFSAGVSKASDVSSRLISKEIPKYLSNY